MAWNLKDLLTRKSAAAQSAADTWFEQGNAHATEGRWQPALDCYREAVRANPAHAAAHAFLGNVQRQLGDTVAALTSYDRAIGARPDFAEAHFNRASLLHRSGRSAEALQGYAAALSLNESFAEAHFARSELLREMNRHDEALEGYDRAIAANSGYAQAYLHRGSLQLQLRHIDAAEASFRQAAALRPDDATAHAARGIALLLKGEAAAALVSLDEAVRLKPDFARAVGNRAEAQAQLGLVAAARASHDQAVLLDPQDAALHFNRGAFLTDQREWAAAIESYQSAIALRPDHADAHCNLGLAQQESGQVEAALGSYTRALTINPRLATAYNNRGNLLRSTRQFARALQDYREALALEPDSADSHYNLGQLALLRGDFASGWPEYEWRRQIAEARAVAGRTLPQPAWHGDTPLQGKRILLHAEQGLGDTLQFCRYAALVNRLGAEVVLEVQAPLVELLANLDGVAQLVAAGSPLPPTDYQCSLMSLAGAFKTTLETIPCAVPYLRADPAKVDRWRETLGARTRPRVGLAWSGNPRHTNDRQRSMALARWIPHLPQAYQYVCLQNEIRDSDRQTVRDCPLIQVFESQSMSFPNTAALMEGLDLVVSVDSSLAHLAGALGLKTWILLPYLPDWRWLLDRRDSPWYPTATLYRQPAAGDWDSVLAEVGQDLRSFFG